MDVNSLLIRFDGRTTLLIRTLSESNDFHRALCVFQKQLSYDRHFLHTFLELLSQNEICCESDAISDGRVKQNLTSKPLVCMFSVEFKRNLLSFIHMVNSVHPLNTVLRLLDCLSQEPCPDPWVLAMIEQLRRDLGNPEKGPLFSPQCSVRLRELCKHLVGLKPAGWSTCFNNSVVIQSAQNGLELSELGTQRKRKSLCGPVSDNQENERLSKRIKVDLSPLEDVSNSDDAVLSTNSSRKDVIVGVDCATTVLRVIPQKQATESPCEALPLHVTAFIPQIKELLESEVEWNQSSTDLVNVLTECDPTQMEVLCGRLCLSGIPEKTLPQLCSNLLALSPDLSYSTATTLIKSLLLGKVLSLSEPASRCLVTAVTSLCTRYPRPACHALIGPVLEDGHTGSAQAELINRLIENGLDPHYRLTVFQMTFKVVWSEGLLSVIHSLLDSKLELNEELFSFFTEQLSAQSPHFTKSIKFAKMMLTVFTKYHNHISSVHKHCFSYCLTSNQTFLKKSLQAALKRITPT